MSATLRSSDQNRSRSLPLFCPLNRHCFGVFWVFWGWGEGVGCVLGCVCELCCFIFYFRWGGGGATAHLPLTVLRFSAAPLSLSPRNVPLHLCRPKFCKLGSFNLFVVIRRRVLRWARPQMHQTSGVGGGGRQRAGRSPFPWSPLHKHG